MEDILTLLQKRSHQDWMIGYSHQKFYSLTEQFYQQFIHSNSLKIIISEVESDKFLAAFLAGVAANCKVFLCNPDWGEKEWQQVLNLVQPDLIVGRINSQINLQKFHTDSFGQNLSNNLNQMIMIPTGGSSGKIRFTIHTWETLKASVKGFQEYFQINQVNSFCILPFYHVSGLMQFLRSFITQGQFFTIPYKSFKESEKYKINLQDYFISVVPTQLQFFLDIAPDWLSQFYTVLLGGSPSWASLLTMARKHNIKLAPTYGMTETASQIVTLKPKDFKQRNNSSGQVLPHAQVKICNQQGNPVEINQTGIITIQSQSLFLGYYPETNIRKNFVTDDLGYFDAQGYLQIIGRNSQKIITGGENVFPIEIESTILETQLVKDVAVIGLSSSQWGEAIAAFYIPQNKHISCEDIKIAIANKIAKFKQPKYWLALENLPRSQQGKINYEELKLIAEQLINRE